MASMTTTLEKSETTPFTFFRADGSLFRLERGSDDSGVQFCLRPGKRKWTFVEVIEADGKFPRKFRPVGAVYLDNAEMMNSVLTRLGFTPDQIVSVKE